MKFWVEARKAIAAARAAAIVAAGAGLLTGDVNVWVTGGLLMAAAFVGTYVAKANETKPATTTERAKE